MHSEQVHIEVDDGKGGRGFLALTGGWHGERDPTVVPLDRAKAFTRGDAEWVVRKLPEELGLAEIVPVAEPAAAEWTTMVDSEAFHGAAHRCSGGEVER